MQKELGARIGYKMEVANLNEPPQIQYKIKTRKIQVYSPSQRDSLTQKHSFDQPHPLKKDEVLHTQPMNGQPMPFILLMEAQGLLLQKSLQLALGLLIT